MSPFLIGSAGEGSAVLRVHVCLHHPKVMEYVRNLPPRHVSRTIEAMLLCAIERGEEQRDLAVRVAEEVGRWLVENGFSVDSKGASGAYEARGQNIPHNAVTAFLQKWRDDD